MWGRNFFLYFIHFTSKAYHRRQKPVQDPKVEQAKTESRKVEEKSQLHPDLKHRPPRFQPSTTLGGSLA